MVAVRNNKDLKDFYEKLVNNGKLKNCCLVDACGQATSNYKQLL
jgi:hypothetical protein